MITLFNHFSCAFVEFRPNDGENAIFKSFSAGLVELSKPGGNDRVSESFSLAIAGYDINGTPTPKGGYKTNVVRTK